MPKLEQIRAWYPDRWNESRVRAAVEKGVIDALDYEDIVGDPYPGPKVTYSFTGLSAADVLRSLNKRANLDELRQACEWLGIEWDVSPKLTRAQLRELIEAAAAGEHAQEAGE